MEIIFYAPLGRNLPPEKRGGAEAGCNKTLGIYKSHGIDVHVVEKTANTGSRLLYLIKTLFTYIEFVWTCLIHPKALVHIVGFYGKIIKIEWLLVKTAKLLGHKVVYEMRNGGMVNIYCQSDDKYQETQRKIWDKADGLLCQGEKFVDFIKQETDKDSFYYPNYIQNIELPQVSDRFDAKALNLIFFGRLVPEKNIKLIIETAAILRRTYPNVKLLLVGGIADAYRRELEGYMSENHIPSNIVEFHGHQNFDYIHDCLLHSHFFLFPSSEPNEGHSNSLTEAMGCGVVPVVSTAGFNESICGDPDLVVTELDANAYAQKVQSLWNRMDWNIKSRQVLEKVANNYTQEIVGNRLVQYMHQVNGDS